MRDLPIRIILFAIALLVGPLFQIICLAQAPPSSIPANPGIPGSASGLSGKGRSGQPGVINQPVIVSSFEDVEMERLRISEEVGKMERNELAFREQVLMLQKKIASASIVAATPESLPTDYRSFISSNAGNIEQSDRYYTLLKATLNDLIPTSPYEVPGANTISDPNRALAKLVKLSEFAEDEDISRTIRAQIAAIRGGAYNDTNRTRQIDKELGDIAKEKKRQEYNYKFTSGVSPLTGRPNGSVADRALILDKVKTLKERENKLREEKNGLSRAVTKTARKLQFQQLIVELAFQQRYIHSLIACGFYRFFSPDMALSKDAYPSRESKPAPSQGTSSNPNAASGTNSASSPPGSEIPLLSTVIGLEAFLQNRIRDAVKDREAMENMLKSNQISGAESLLRKMVLTAKYQPELNTIPYEERQRVHQFGQDMKKLSDALNSRNYVEMKKLAEGIKGKNTDVGMADIEAFATEHPKKALFWVRQAEVALKVGDRKSMQSLMSAAVERAPLDPEVDREIKELQDAVIEDRKLGDELEQIVKAKDYRQAFDRMNEFAPLADSSTDKQLKADFEDLIEKEKTIRTTLEKSDAFAERSNYSGAWVVLSEVDSGVEEDSRLANRKSQIAGKNPRFISAYSKGVEHEKSGETALALAWYLSALSEAPGSTADFEERVGTLSNELINK